MSAMAFGAAAISGGIWAHDGHHAGSGAVALSPAFFGMALLAAAGYLVLAAACRRRGRAWRWWRTGSFMAGLALVVLGLSPYVSPLPASDLREHMAQHLLVGMFAPLALVLGAPVTLALRGLPARYAGAVGRALHSRPVSVLVHPVPALVLSAGGVAAVYLTPLYRATVANPTLHALVHVHFLLAGFLFAWAVAGQDPAPRRPGVPARLVVLGVAIAVHAAVAQLIYAGLTGIPAPPHELRGAADLMYYGGDTAELLLALAMLTRWRPRAQPRETLVVGRAAEGSLASR